MRGGGSRPPCVDAHTHVFCWGENPADGYLSERTHRSWLTRLLLYLTGIRREPGQTLSEKMRNRLLRQVNSRSLTTPWCWLKTRSIAPTAHATTRPRTSTFPTTTCCGWRPIAHASYR